MNAAWSKPPRLSSMGPATEPGLSIQSLLARFVHRSSMGPATEPTVFVPPVLRVSPTIRSLEHDMN
jgi:hypothetical protein